MNPTSAASPSAGTGNEDFCHLCQKQFCNKYYLKKHKADVHGLGGSGPNTINGLISSSATTLSSSQTAATTVKSVDPTGLLSQITQMNPSFLSSVVQMSQHAARSNMSSSSPCSSTSSASSVSSSYSSLSLPSASVHTQPEKQHSSASSIASSSSSSSSTCSGKDDVDKKIHSNLEEAYALINNKAKAGSSGASSSFLAGSSAPHKLPTTLVTAPKSDDSNGQVRCDECTKVFYSKDFLALHKLNKHGAKRPSEASLIPKSDTFKELNHSEHLSHRAM